MTTRIELHPIESDTNADYPTSYDIESGISLIGSQPALTAGDSTGYRLDGTGYDTASFLLPLLEVDPATVTAIGYHARLYAENPAHVGNVGLNLVVYGYGSDLGNFTIEEGTVPTSFGGTKAIVADSASATTHDAVISDTNYADFYFAGTMSMARLAGYLAHPGRATMRLGTISPTTARPIVVTEAWLWVEYVDTIPPLRQHPRGDGLGLSGTRRPFGNRSQQASDRRVGGGFL